MQDIRTHKQPLGLGGLFRSQFGIYATHFWQIYSTTILLVLIPLLVALAMLGPSETLKWFANANMSQSLGLGGETTEATGQSTEATGDQSADDPSDTPAQGAAGDESGDQTAGTPGQTGDDAQPGSAGQDAGTSEPSADWAELFSSAGGWTSLPVEVAVEVAVRALTGGFFVAAVALFVFDVKLGKDARFSSHIGTALLRAIPIILLNFIAVLLIFLGFLLLLVPGLWLYGVFAVIAPVVAIEGRIFSALGRSAALTKGYRWPCLGYLLSVAIIVVLLNVPLALLTGLLASLLAPLGAILSALLALLAFLIFFALFLPIAALASPVLYVRLRELKNDPA